MKVLVIGGGIAGLAIAWRLSREGSTVEIVERGMRGRSASWAAAVLIAPARELDKEDSAVASFAREARNLWPSFAAELEQASGMSVFFTETDSVILAETESDAAQLRRRAPVAAQWLSSEQLLSREPLLSPRLKGALSISGDAQVDNRSLGDALFAALVANGALIHENCEALSLVIERGSARAVVTQRGTMQADAILLTSGAWMALMSGTGLNLPPIKPVKGQMLALSPPQGVGLPKSLIWSDHVYLVAQRDTLLIGATVEDAGFDASVDRHCANMLLESASRLIPSLPYWRLAEIWAGLRPRTPDDAPVLGRTAISNLFVAGGQFRNGILFAPIIADCMAKVLRGQDPGPLAAAFDARRFSETT